MRSSDGSTQPCKVRFSQSIFQVAGQTSLACVIATEIKSSRPIIISSPWRKRLSTINDFSKNCPTPDRKEKGTRPRNAQLGSSGRKEKKMENNLEARPEEVRCQTGESVGQRWRGKSLVSLDGCTITSLFFVNTAMEENLDVRRKLFVTKNTKDVV